MPKRDKPREFRKTTVSRELFAEVSALLSKLRQLKPHKDERSGLLMPQLIPLSPEAERIFIEFYNEVGGIIHQSAPRDAAQWSKLIGYSARLALVGQLAHDPDAKEITGEIMKHACALARWFGTEAMRIYAMLAETPEQRGTRMLVEFIKSHGGEVTVRDVYTYYRPLKNKRDEAERRLNALVKEGLVEGVEIKPDGKGRPTVKFRLIQASASAQIPDSRGKTPNCADADKVDSEKITPLVERNAEAVSEEVDAMPEGVLEL
jgi:hypothetical protein